MSRALVLACLVLAGCLTRDAGAPRFYHPDAAMLDAPADAPPDGPPRTSVRLRPVHEAGFLRERMVWRTSEVEYGRYEQRRWNELPAQYVERAMANSLQSSASLALTDDLAAASLGLDLLAFEEIVGEPHVARVMVRASLRSAKGRTVMDRQFSVDEPITDDGGDGVARAMGKALDTITAQVTNEVAARLAPRAGRTAARTRPDRRH